MDKIKAILWVSVVIFVVTSCNNDEEIFNPQPSPGPKIYTLPIVVHIFHFGEPVGSGYNLSKAQIESQIRVLNEDFRRKEGTRGFNEHPAGGDARIEFVLASTAPDGSPTDGIVRIEAKEGEVHFRNYEYYASISYWDPKHYINVWTEPLPTNLNDLVLGLSTFPETDLPGWEIMERDGPVIYEGIFVNAAHFGESDLISDYNLGRTLTHELGHYLGLFHPWGKGDCTNNDYCDDTPAVRRAHGGCAENAPIGCDGEVAMVENFMNYTSDRCMNVFTNGQIERMHYVLENSKNRKSLLTSPGLPLPQM